MSSGLLFDTLMVMTSGSSGITECLMHPAGAASSISVGATILTNRDTYPAPTLPRVMRLRTEDGDQWRSLELGIREAIGQGLYGQLSVISPWLSGSKQRSVDGKPVNLRSEATKDLPDLEQILRF